MCDPSIRALAREILNQLMATGDAGTYLPLTAVLGGSLFVRPEGFLEADRDVIRLSPSIQELQQQVRTRTTKVSVRAWMGGTKFSSPSAQNSQQGVSAAGVCMHPSTVY